MEPQIMCPLCKTPATASFTEYEGYTVKIYKCPKCREMFFSPHELEPVEPKG